MDYLNKLEANLNCKYNFRCKAEGEGKTCPVTKKLNDSFVFIEPINHNSCNYKFHYGCSVICSCPLKAKLSV